MRLRSSGMRPRARRALSEQVCDYYTSMGVQLAAKAVCGSAKGQMLFCVLISLTSSFPHSFICVPSTALGEKWARPASRRCVCSTLFGSGRVRDPAAHKQLPPRPCRDSPLLPHNPPLPPNARSLAPRRSCGTSSPSTPSMATPWTPSTSGCVRTARGEPSTRRRALRSDDAAPPTPLPRNTFARRSARGARQRPRRPPRVRWGA
jgi:hypothetical protein